MRTTKSEMINDLSDYEKIRSKLVYNNTIEYTKENGDRVIRHFNTDIMIFKPNGSIIIDCGGYRSVTTKRRLNTYLPDGWGIYQDRGKWYLNYNDNTYYNSDWRKGSYLFFDGIKIKGNKVIGLNEIKKEEKRIQSITKKINKYIKGFKEYMEKEGIPFPNGGDCWLCCMVDSNGESWGDKTKDNNHLISHFKENYYHGSIIVNALKDAGYQDNQIGYYIHPESFLSKEDKIKTIIRSLRRYLKKQFSIAV